MDQINDLDFTTADPTLSLLSIGNIQTPGFDYSVYLQQQQDLDHLAEESSSTSVGNPFPVSTGTIPQTLTPPPHHFSTSPAQSSAAILHHDPNRSSDAGTTSSTSQPSPNPEIRGAKGKQRLERRGHTKSRRGCFNCKRRRIKCQETKPSCGHCLKGGLECTYPSPPLSAPVPLTHQPSSGNSLLLPQFSLLDLRLFHHFLSVCHPHHPIGSEPLWTHEVPCLSQSHPYLMHAILGYSASDLAQNPSPPSDGAALITSAMSHRLKAIKAIKQALAESSSNASRVRIDGTSGGRGADHLTEEGNALMATCFALTYQSVLLDDGMVEYMTFIRGIVIVAVQMYVAAGVTGPTCSKAQRVKEKMLFGELLSEGESEKRVEPHMKNLGLVVRREWVDAAVEAINNLEGLLLPREEAEEGSATSVEREYWGLLSNMAGNLYVSSWAAYLALTEHYRWWMMLAHEKFQRLVEPGNMVGVLLASHWIALKQIMASITEVEEKAAGAVCYKNSESRGRGAGKPGNDISLGIIRWLKYLNALVDEEHQVYNAWPRWVEAQLDADRGYFGKTH